MALHCAVEALDRINLSLPLPMRHLDSVQREKTPLWGEGSRRELWGASFGTQQPWGRMNRRLDVRYRMNHTTKGLTLIHHYHSWLSLVG